MTPANAAARCRHEAIDMARSAVAARLIAGAFSRDEPLAVAVGQTHDEFMALLGLFLPAALPAGLTMGAFLGPRLVGVALTTAYDFMPPPGTEEASPRYPPIGALIAALERDYERDNAARLKRCAHIHMLAVDADMRGNGVAQGLVDATARNARSKGFEAIVSDATNPASQGVFKRLGFETLNAVRYDRFRLNGDMPFASLAHLGAIALMEKRL